MGTPQLIATISISQAASRDRQVARHHVPAYAARPRRRSHRITRQDLMTLLGAQRLVSMRSSQSAYSELASRWARTRAGAQPCVARKRGELRFPLRAALADPRRRKRCLGRGPATIISGLPPSRYCGSNGPAGLISEDPAFVTGELAGPGTYGGVAKDRRSH